MKMILHEEALEKKRELVETKAKELGVRVSWERPGRAVLLCEEDRRCEELLRSLLLLKRVEGPSMWESLSELESGQRT